MLGLIYLFAFKMLKQDKQAKISVPLDLVLHQNYLMSYIKIS